MVLWWRSRFAKPASRLLLCAPMRTHPRSQPVPATLSLIQSPTLQLCPRPVPTPNSSLFYKSLATLISRALFPVFRVVPSRPCRPSRVVVGRCLRRRQAVYGHPVLAQKMLETRRFLLLLHSDASDTCPSFACKSSLVFRCQANFWNDYSLSEIGRHQRLEFTVTGTPVLDFFWLDSKIVRVMVGIISGARMATLLEGCSSV